jgi:LysR family hydrogen peroxide-inducible transcriptional activator
LELYLREDLTASLVERLADGSLDAAVLALPYEAPGIDWIEFAEDPFMFVAQPDSPLAGKRPVRGADLKSARLLLLEDGHCLREHALDACKLRQSEFTDHYGATSLFTLVQMVRAGLGVTLLPKMAIDAGLAADSGLTVAPLAAPAPARKIGVAWRKGSGRREDCELLAAAFGAVSAKKDRVSAGH